MSCLVCVQVTCDISQVGVLGHMGSCADRIGLQVFKSTGVCNITTDNLHGAKSVRGNSILVWMAKNEEVLEFDVLFAELLSSCQRKIDAQS